MNSKLDDSEVNFVRELPTVFNILKNNPEAIVDDTAIERLLSWLEEICRNNKSKEFIDVCLVFLRSDELWVHKVTAAFGLRLLGHLGDFYKETDLAVVEFVQDVFHLDTIIREPLFQNASVQFAYYKCLQSLSKNEIWVKYINEFMWPILLNTWNTSTLFVKKAAVSFLATYLYSLGQCGKDEKLNGVLEAQMNFVKIAEDGMTPTAPPLTSSQVACIGRSLVELLTKDHIVGLAVLNIYQYLQLLLRQIKINEPEDQTELIQTAIELFKAISQASISADMNWDSLMGADGIESLQDLLDKSCTSDNNSQVSGPSSNYIKLCGSLLQPKSSKRSFHHMWNSCLLYRILHQVIPKVNLDEGLQLISDLERNLPPPEGSSKSWKSRLMEASTVLSTIDLTKILNKQNPTDYDLMGRMVMYLQEVMLVSLGATVDNINDQRIYYLVNDRKISLSCYQFFKKFTFEYFKETFVRHHAKFLLRLLSLPMESAQMICNVLELTTKFVSQAEVHLEYLLEASTSDISGSSVGFIDKLNLKLWDISWEVKDSVLTCLITLFAGVRQGYKKHKEIMENRRFWCNVLSLLDDDESFVRAKTVTLLGHVYVSECLWKIFCEENHHSKAQFWDRFEVIFTDDRRLDDMFTRRSILCMISDVIRHDQVFFFSVFGDEGLVVMTGGEEAEIIFRILKNGFLDFDWEVRKLVVVVCTGILKQFLKNMKNTRPNITANVTDPFESFLSILISNGFMKLLLDAMISDCELAVNLEAINYFNMIRQNCKKQASFYNSQTENMVNTFSIAESGLIKTGNITTRDELEESIKKNPVTDYSSLFDLLADLNFDWLSHQSNGLDETVKSDPLSFVHDIIASCKQSEENLLDCY